MEIIMYIAIVLVILLTSFVYFIYTLKDKVFKEMFKKKDLPIKDTIKLGKRKKITIYLYDLKKQKDGLLDREDDTYARLAKIINKDLEIKIVNNELTIEKPDYSHEDYKLKMMDMVALVTNFNYSQFVFRGEDKFKLYTMKTQFTDKLKEHTLEIIDEVFTDIASRIEEGVADSLHE